MVQLKYTRHVQDRMRERSITKADIECCLRNQVQLIDSAKTYAIKGPGCNGKMLKVWFVPPKGSEPARIVKSAAWEGEDT